MGHYHFIATQHAGGRSNDGRGSGRAADKKVDWNFFFPLRFFQEGNAIVTILSRSSWEWRACGNDSALGYHSGLCRLTANFCQPALTELVWNAAGDLGKGNSAHL
jgi:hypothetical protein